MLLVVCRYLSDDYRTLWKKGSPQASASRASSQKNSSAPRRSGTSAASWRRWSQNWKRFERTDLFCSSGTFMSTKPKCVQQCWDLCPSILGWPKIFLCLDMFTFYTVSGVFLSLFFKCFFSKFMINSHLHQRWPLWWRHSVRKDGKPNNSL